MRLLLIEFNYKAESRASTLFSNYERRRSKQKTFFENKNSFLKYAQLFLHFWQFFARNFKKNSAKNLFWDFFAYFSALPHLFLLPPSPCRKQRVSLICFATLHRVAWFGKLTPLSPHRTKWVSFSPFLLCFLAFFLSSPSFLCVGSALNGKGLFFLLFLLLPRERGGERERKKEGKRRKKIEKEREEKETDHWQFFQQRGPIFLNQYKRKSCIIGRGWIQCTTF